MYVTLKSAVDRAWARNRSRSAERNHLAMDADLIRDIGLNPGDLHARLHGAAARFTLRNDWVQCREA